MLDGEIVVLKEGKPDFQALLERGQAVSPREIERQQGRSPAIYIVFDILGKTRPIDKTAFDGEEKNPKRIPKRRLQHNFE